jgi:His-Xaa-Ser system radical SAM maturase HxsC
MCYQPPKAAHDSWLLDRAAELIRLLPQDTTDLTFTGGEPTLSGDRFLELLRLVTERLPQAEIHILSNGRRFADFEFASAFASVGNPRIMVGIPVYGSEASLHDYVVQAPGAFDETVRGILNLARLEQRIEIRVVLHQQTAPAILEIAEFISRNLPFVEQVALMGLEMMGLARGNIGKIWIDPFEYRSELTEAALTLSSAGIRTMIYNHQLCLLERRAWPFAVQSISDWKNEYDGECEPCHMRTMCGGFFHSAKYRSSPHIRAIDGSGTPLPTRAEIPFIGTWSRRVPT